MATSSTASYSLAPQAPTEFHLFPKLPIEIRLMVWKKASFISRAVHLSIRRLDSDPIKIQLVSKTHVPAILQTNQESRQEAANHYVLAFGNSWFLDPPGPTEYKFPDTVYINFGVDYVMLDDTFQNAWGLSHNLRTYPIKRLVMPSELTYPNLSLRGQWETVERVVKIKNLEDASQALEQLESTFPLGKIRTCRRFEMTLHIAWNYFWVDGVSDDAAKMSEYLTPTPMFSDYKLFTGRVLDYGNFEVFEKISWGPITNEDIKAALLQEKEDKI
jgi:hypothetical protein